MRTIADENRYYIRQAMDIACFIYPDEANVSSFSEVGNTWYGGSTYKINYTVDKPHKKAILMDFAGGGFYNNGEAIPISNKKQYGCTTYGIPAKTIDGEIICDLIYDRAGSGKFTRIAFDSKGVAYRSTSSSSDATTEGFSNCRWSKDMFSGFPENERLYWGYWIIDYGYYFDSSCIKSCTLNLRAVNTELDNPALEASEISLEVKDFIGTTAYQNLPENTRIYYSAGYSGDMSEPRCFYLNDVVQKSYEGYLSFSGYDATGFLDDEFYGDLTFFDRNSGIKGYATYLSNLISNTLDYKGIKFSKKSHNDLAARSDAAGEYVYVPEGTVRDRVAEAVNVFRAPDGGYNNTGVYYDYVDAGFPFFAAHMDQVDSIYSFSKAHLNIGNVAYDIPTYMISSWNREFERPFGTLRIEASGFEDIINPKLLEERKVKKGSRFWVEPDELLCAFSETVPAEVTFIDQFIRGSGTINNLSYYAFGPKKFKMTAAAANNSQKLYGWFFNVYDATGSPFTKKGTGSDKITLPEFVGDIACIQNPEDTERKWVFRNCIDNIAQRSNQLYTFTWRGDPRLQPRDVITARGIVMTVDSLTLEHSEGGGFSSTVVARKGRV